MNRLAKTFIIVLRSHSKAGVGNLHAGDASPILKLEGGEKTRNWFQGILKGLLDFRFNMN